MRPDFVVPQKNGVCWSCRLWERSLLDLGLLIEPVVGVVGVAVVVVVGLGVVGLGVWAWGGGVCLGVWRRSVRGWPRCSMCSACSMCSVWGVKAAHRGEGIAPCHHDKVIRLP